MAIVQAILAALTRWAGTILNTAFAWATIMLFGKVPKDRQIYLSINSFGSVLWLIALLGIIFPSFTIFLLSFVTLPSWVDKKWIRIAMAVAAVILPAIVGCMSIFMLSPEKRPRDVAGKVQTILRGYPYTLGMAVTLIMMCVFAPIMELRNLAKGWTSAHMPMVVESQDYLEVVGDVQKTLARCGFETHREPTTWMLRYPTKLLSLLAGGQVHDLVSDEMTTLVSTQIEVMLHPSDLAIRGREFDVAHARAALTQYLGFTKAHMTWDKQANELEDELRQIWLKASATSNGDRKPAATTQAEASVEELNAIDRKLSKMQLPYEEWQVLFLERLLVEREILRRKDVRVKPSISSGGGAGETSVKRS
jgi:hypothetical protein